MRVICVKWGDKYGAEWVYNLRRMVRRNTFNIDFVCMTDKPIDFVDCIPCEDGLPGWWSKIGLFKPGKFPGLNLYLDLDVVINGGLEDIVASAEPGKVSARDDFSYSLKKPEFLNPEMERFIGGKGTVNSSVMVWNDDDGRDVWDKFTPEVMDEMHGDQNFISKVLFPDKLAFLPDDLIHSYKYHVLRGEGNGVITVFHGHPKVTDLPKDHSLRQRWEG